MVDTKGGNLGISWHDSAWIPLLNPGNIMDYFSERSNPFYDRTCNNEIVKMQRLNPEQLNNLTGVEYILLHVQDPILYVVRKQHRHSPTQVTPLADYYIIAGVVYQAPDLSSVINSRMLSTAHHLQTAFDEAQSFSRYHPSKGYWWEFKDNVQPDTKKKTKESTKMEMSSVFQRQRVDVLLAELAKKFPPKVIAQPPPQPQPAEKSSASAEEPKPVEPKVEVKQEKTETAQGANAVPATATSPAAASGPPKNPPGSAKPPLEKRPRLMA